MALTRGVSSIHRPPPGLQPISATEGALRPALPPTCPSMGSRAAPTDGSCGSQSTEHKAQLTCSSLCLMGRKAKGSAAAPLGPRPGSGSPAPSASQLSTPVTGTGGSSLAGQPECAPPSDAGQTDHLWLANPSCLPGAAVDPARSPRRRLHSPRPRLSPGRPSPTPMSHPDCGRTLPAWEEPGSGFQILRTDTEAPLVPPHRHPPEFQGREVPGSWGAATPARPGHARPNLSATSRLPDTSRPLSPQQQFEAGQAPRGGYRPGAPSPAAGGLARAVGHLLDAPAPSLGAAAAPPRVTSFRHGPAATPAAPARPGSAGAAHSPAAAVRSPRRSAAARAGLGRLVRALGPCAAARPARLVAPSCRGVVRGVVRGRVGRATEEQRSARPRPAPRAPRRGLRAALRADGRGCGLQPGAPSARSAKCTPQAWRPRPARLLRLRCPPHSLLCRSPSLPSPLRSPPPRLQATPPASSPAAILTPEWPEVPSPQHTPPHAGGRSWVGPRSSSLSVWGQWCSCAFSAKLG